MGSQISACLEALGFYVTEQDSDTVAFRRAKPKLGPQLPWGASSVVDSGAIRIARRAAECEVLVSTSFAGFVIASLLLFCLLSIMTFLIEDGLNWRSVLMLLACLGAFVLLPVRLGGSKVNDVIRKSIDDLPGFDVLD